MRRSTLPGRERPWTARCDGRAKIPAHPVPGAKVQPSKAHPRADSGASPSAGLRARRAPRRGFATDSELRDPTREHVGSEYCQPGESTPRVELQVFHRVAGVKVPKFVCFQLMERGKTLRCEEKIDRGASRAAIGQSFAADPALPKKTSFVGQRSQTQSSDDLFRLGIHAVQTNHGNAKERKRGTKQWAFSRAFRPFRDLGDNPEPQFKPYNYSLKRDRLYMISRKL